jgi:hypothetical protein
MRQYHVLNDIPRGSVETQTTRSACDNCYFAIEREDALEVVELDVGFGRHGECMYRICMRL